MIKSRPDSYPVLAVDSSDTICKALATKNLIPWKDYEFEYQEVSQHYNWDTFVGYQILIKPVVVLTRNSFLIDPIVHFFVKHWIAIHKKIIWQKKPLPIAKECLRKFAVYTANGLGSFILLFRGTNNA